MWNRSLLDFIYSVRSWLAMLSWCLACFSTTIRSVVLLNKQTMAVLVFSTWLINFLHAAFPVLLGRLDVTYGLCGCVWSCFTSYICNHMQSVHAQPRGWNLGVKAVCYTELKWKWKNGNEGLWLKLCYQTNRYITGMWSLQHRTVSALAVIPRCKLAAADCPR